MLTIAKAAEIVRALPAGHLAQQLFVHFDDFFQISKGDKEKGTDNIITFAELCGFPIATKVIRLQ